MRKSLSENIVIQWSNFTRTRSSLAFVYLTKSTHVVTSKSRKSDSVSSFMVLYWHLVQKINTVDLEILLSISIINTQLELMVLAPGHLLGEQWPASRYIRTPSPVLPEYYMLGTSISFLVSQISILLGNSS